MIDNISNNATANTLLFNRQQAAEKTSNKASQDALLPGEKEPMSDQVDISYSSEPASTYQYDISLEKNAGDGLDLLRGLVLNIFKEQGLEYNIETSDGTVNLETITPEEAEELVADDGYFGVEKTAERIFNFAVGVAGGDPGRIDVIKEGVTNGFEEALEAFGGELPDISYDTFDAVINKLDDWAGSTESPESSIQVKS